ncbi:DUF202 domain-containing protein [Streptomyces sp. NPDC059637]|uniref:DUF202 domain-containing protein n=1 Tax=Streptomyces sp. NPDC059637 TaxID=3347752 RepID=UPI0036C05B2B
MSSGAGPDERDPARQPERTHLAWRRTVLSCGVVALLAVRQALAGERPVPEEVAVLAAVTLVWTVFFAVTQRRVREVAPARPAAMSPRTAAAVTVCTVALAVVGAVTALF